MPISNDYLESYTIDQCFPIFLSLGTKNPWTFFMQTTQSLNTILRTITNIIFLNLNILIIELHRNALNILVIKINWLTTFTNLGYFVTHFVANKQKFFQFLFLWTYLGNFTDHKWSADRTFGNTAIDVHLHTKNYSRVPCVLQ
jgi:hypothetical protein